MVLLGWQWKFHSEVQTVFYTRLNLYLSEMMFFIAVLLSTRLSVRHTWRRQVGGQAISLESTWRRWDIDTGHAALWREWHQGRTLTVTGSVTPIPTCPSTTSSTLIAVKMSHAYNEHHLRPMCRPNPLPFVRNCWYRVGPGAQINRCQCLQKCFFKEQLGSRTSVQEVWWCAVYGMPWGIHTPDVYIHSTPVGNCNIITRWGMWGYGEGLSVFVRG